MGCPSGPTGRAATEKTKSSQKEQKQSQAPALLEAKRMVESHRPAVVLGRPGASQERRVDAHVFEKHRAGGEESRWHIGAGKQRRVGPETPAEGHAPSTQVQGGDDDERDQRQVVRARAMRGCGAVVRDRREKVDVAASKHAKKHEAGFLGQGGTGIPSRGQGEPEGSQTSSGCGLKAVIAG